MNTTAKQEIPLQEFFSKFIETANKLLAKETLSGGHMQFWSGSVRTRLVKIYGTDHSKLGSETNTF